MFTKQELPNMYNSIIHIDDNNIFYTDFFVLDLKKSHFSKTAIDKLKEKIEIIKKKEKMKLERLKYLVDLYNQGLNSSKPKYDDFYFFNDGIKNISTNYYCFEKNTQDSSITIREDLALLIYDLFCYETTALLNLILIDSRLAKIYRNGSFIGLISLFNI